jgi:hypothetical protein
MSETPTPIEVMVAALDEEFDRYELVDHHNGLYSIYRNDGSHREAVVSNASFMLRDCDADRHFSAVAKGAAMRAALAKARGEVAS